MSNKGKRLTEAEASRLRQKLWAGRVLHDEDRSSQLFSGTQRCARAEHERAAEEMQRSRCVYPDDRPSREPKSIYAEVKSFSIPKPRRGSPKRPDGYQAAKVRHGKGPWITIART